MDTQLLKDDLDKGLIGPRVLLSGVRLLDEASRESPEYNDSLNFPFWYHLGKQVGVKQRAFQIGPKLGMIPYCLLQCAYFREWVCFGGNNSFVVKNIQERSSHTKVSFQTQLDEHDGLYQLCLLTQEYDFNNARKFLDFLWLGLESGGLLVVDYIDSEGQGEAFDEFCRVKNRESVKFKTRYGVGIIER